MGGDIKEGTETTDPASSSENVPTSGEITNQEKCDEDQDAKEPDDDSKSILSADIKPEENGTQNCKEGTAQEPEDVKEESIVGTDAVVAETKMAPSDSENEVKDLTDN